ncbi:MAG: H-NS histone family protein [Pseudomonadota bacterium]|nr:H-NS histone family protein [Pseudomonadota bacterium]
MKGTQMSNLVEIQSQIEKLQKQASEIKSRQFDKTVQEILALMQAFGITVKDLKPRSGRGTKTGTRKRTLIRASGAAKKKSTGPVAVKYRGPTGETWSGRGLTPKWLSALVAQGKTKEEFFVKN